MNQSFALRDSKLTGNHHRTDWNAPPRKRWAFLNTGSKLSDSRGGRGQTRPALASETLGWVVPPRTQACVMLKQDCYSYWKANSFLSSMSDPKSRIYIHPRQSALYPVWLNNRSILGKQRWANRETWIYPALCNCDLEAVSAAFRILPSKTESVSSLDCSQHRLPPPPRISKQVRVTAL